MKIRGLRRAGLEPFDFDLADGECVAVRGPSGAGKTILLRAIADLDPNHGSVSLDGSARESIPAPQWRRSVCYLAAEAGWWADAVAAHFPDREAPRVLLLDEPTSGLDPDSTLMVEAVLRRRLDEGASVLLVTHARDQARRLALRGLVVDGGRIVEAAP